MSLAFQVPGDAVAPNRRPRAVDRMSLRRRLAIDLAIGLLVT